MLAAGPVGAQENSFITDAVLINPGARSIALGGAFAAIADDATAALANPAGLVQIVRPEISAEFRGTASTSAFAAPFEADAGVSGLGFFSFVYPGKNWAVAIYSHQLASLDFTFLEANPFSRELTVQSYSASFGYQLTDRLSIGVGASYYDADSGGSNPDARTSDSDNGFNAGLLWNAAAHWRIAGFYRQGPDFETSASSTGTTGDPAANSGLIFPDVYGAAASFQPGSGGLTLGFELDRIGSTTEPLPNGAIVTDGGTEVHLGIEYAILKWKPVVAFRAGFWREPGGDQRIVENAAVASAVSSSSAEHLSVGFGFAFSRFQLDFGADFSDRAVIGSMSMVISF